MPPPGPPVNTARSGRRTAHGAAPSPESAPCAVRPPRQPTLVYATTPRRIDSTALRAFFATLPPSGAATAT